MSSRDAPFLPASTDTGALGVFQLKRIWASHVARANGSASRRREWAIDEIVLCGLNLALEETLGCLANAQPAFAAFETWVLERNDGRLDPRQVARINAAVSGAHPTRPVACEASQPGEDKVFDAADHAPFAEHGYVVLRQAVPRRAAIAAADALCRHIGVDLADAGTWYASRTHGIMLQLFHHPALAANRASRRIRSAFEELWGSDDLWMTVDRISFNPPERDGWRFPGPHPHWDVDLSARPLRFATQGILYLTDTPAHQGAFACLPGFHHRMEAWLAARASDSYPQAQELGAVELTPIPGEAGDLVIWHHALPHAATPNAGTRPRIVHYVNMRPTPAVQ